ncbi:uncharacterized protein LOC122396868 [Colletes gigas]|uniref:uncharacterized protein LOC122396868 n=1 Tax=Colletes gigas TaxID=935657 RepID=UPI001C9B1FAF|nr:uncharacterized protein LOC122396868 [Colletes gigas]
MKLLLAISCLLVVATMVRSDLSEVRGKYKLIMEEHIAPCAMEHSVLPTEMSNFDVATLEGEDRTKFGCMKACILKRLGVMDESSFKPENFQEVIEKVFTEPDKVTEQLSLANYCVEKVKENTDPCDAAFEFTKCTMTGSIET